MIWPAILALAVALPAQAGPSAPADKPAAADKPAPADKPLLSLVAGPPRAFGGTTITRTFRIAGAEKCHLVWESSVFRGIVNHGELPVDAPGDVKVVMDLPEVRARVEMVQKVQLKRDGKVLAEGHFALGLFSTDALPEYGRATADLPPIGLCDPGKFLAPVLDKTGIKYTLLETNLQARALASKLILVGPNQPDSPSEPMGGIRESLEQGATAIFLEQDSAKKGFFDAEKPVEVAEREVPSAGKLIDEKHILLRDLRAGDLADWAGSGAVAARVLAWPACPGFQAWLVGGEGKDQRPLAAQYWGANGRVIVCQLEVGRRLADEPAAHLVLRNLLAYAREKPLPAPGRTARFAVPTEALADGKFNTARFVPEPKPEDLKAAAGLLLLALPKEAVSAPAPGFDLGRYLAQGGKLVVQSKFGPEFVEALNQLAGSTWPDKPNLTVPRFVAASAENAKAVEIRFAKPLTWGISAEDFRQGLGDAEDRRSLRAEPDVPEFVTLAGPGFLAEFRRDKSRLVLCALPVDDPENEPRARVVRQIVANLTLAEDKDGR